MLNFEQLTLLHRHDDDWRPMDQVQHPSPDDSDIERRLLRGEKLFRCASCELEVMAVPPDEA